MTATYRNDPRWQAAQADYAADRPWTSPQRNLLDSSAAAHRMFEIECEHAEAGGHR